MINDAAKMAKRLTDEDLKRAYDALRGNPKRSPRRLLSAGEAIALAAVSDELARRTAPAPEGDTDD